MKAVNDFTIDFQSQHYDNEAALARKILTDLLAMLKMKDPSSHFGISDTRSTVAGWSFGKLFLSLELVQKLYETNRNEIEQSKGKTLEDKFISWLNRLLVEKAGCETLALKAADEMRDFGRFTAGKTYGFS